MFLNLFIALAISGSYAYAAMTDEEVKVLFTKFVMKCQKDHPVEVNELIALQSMKVPTNKDTKCLLACAYKAEGSMNDKGMYDLEHAYKVAEETQKGDEKRLANAKKLADICSKDGRHSNVHGSYGCVPCTYARDPRHMETARDELNEESVNDGEKGCDRAALIFKCFAQNAPKLGFKL